MCLISRFGHLRILVAVTEEERLDFCRDVLNPPPKLDETPGGLGNLRRTVSVFTQKNGPGATRLCGRGYAFAHASSLQITRVCVWFVHPYLKWLKRHNRTTTMFAVLVL